MYKFPKDSKLNNPEFIFGVATASYQIEGATNVDERCDSIWDTFCATPGMVYKQHNGDVACNHYNLYEQDVELIASLNVDAYRLSIAWPRIIKEDGSVNQKGLNFYDRLITALERKNITVMATLYHWDLPQYLEDKGGWLNRETSVKFAEYADVISQYFGDRISFYVTLNEPWCSAFHGYRYGIHAPGIADETSGFLACHNLLLAHGMAMPILRKNAKKSQHGIVLNFTPNYPVDESSIEAADFADDEHTHWFIKPLMEGRYPSSVFQHFKDYMPKIEENDMAIISEKIDFLGVNFYSRSMVTNGRQGKVSDTILKKLERAEIRIIESDEVLEDGWLNTGDIGYLDEEGYLWLSDRKIDMIISGGVNIYPAEIEAVIAEHPGVADVSVIGVPNEEFGEEVKAVGECSEGHQANDEFSKELLQLCNQKLAGYKRPKSIDFVSQLPRTGTGKILKRKLREPYWEGLERSI